MRKKDIKVSIVVPSLNVKPYINECIDSIIAQSLDEIEIICVDAKSEDGTLEALKQYEASGIIKLITSDVRSYGVQMNMGIHEAKGEYVGFVESDDFIDEFMYEKLYKCACNNDADVVMSDYIMFEDYNGGRNEYLKRIGANQNMYNQILCPSKNAVMLRGNYINPTGLFRKTFLEENNIFFNETPGAAYQDVGFLFLLLLKARKWVNIDAPFYFYRQDNPNSSIASKEKLECPFDEYSYIYANLEDNKWALPIFYCRKFGSYLHTLDRVCWDLKYDCIKRINQEFSIAKAQEELDTSLFSPSWISTLNQILLDPLAFYEKHIRLRESVYKNIKMNRNIVIYGCGVVGKKIFDLMDVEEQNNVIGFAVSKQENEYIYKGKHIEEIWKYIERRKDLSVLVGTSSKYLNEILVKLDNMGFANVITLDGVVDEW